MLLLVPANPLRPKAPDPHFAGEYNVARELGLAVAVVDHDALECGSADSAVRSVPPSGDVVYRGWMLRSEQYRDLERALSGRGSVMRTSAAQYRGGHELPGWYAALEDHTPASVWTADERVDSLETLRVLLRSGRAVLRDYSKSLKHHWSEAMYIPDLTDAVAVSAVARRFVELRGTSLVGGLVLREFEDFVGPEIRTWWFDGACKLITAHPDTPGGTRVPDLEPFVDAVRGLNLPFVTVDFAMRSDGRWRIVELGDGQVSGRPTDLPPEELVTALAETGRLP